MAEQEDMLAALFTMQAALNDHIFSTQSLTGPDGGRLQMQAIVDAMQRGELGVNDLPNQWLARYARAMAAELQELDAELLWKWWSRDQLDVQNVRVELIDILHFLISAMISVGMQPADVLHLYRQKHAVNMQRQDQGYGRDNKDQADNRAIVME